MRMHWLPGMLLLSALLMGGCSDSDGRAEAEARQDRTEAVAEAENRQDQADAARESAGSSIYLHNLPYRWNTAASEILENTENHDLGRFEVSVFGESLRILHAWGDERNDSHVRLTGFANRDDGRIERIYVDGKQTDFGDPHLQHLRPYFEISRF